jgi:hypothetical protein
MNIREVIEFIYDETDEQDITNIFNACKSRKRVLGQCRAAQVRVDQQVRVVNISPKYLNGLTGKVEFLSGSRCDIQLDERSKARIAITRHGRAGGLLSGVPTSCIVPQEETS